MSAQGGGSGNGPPPGSQGKRWPPAGGPGAEGGARPDGTGAGEGEPPARPAPPGQLGAQPPGPGPAPLGRPPRAGHQPPPPYQQPPRPLQRLQPPRPFQPPGSPQAPGPGQAHPPGAPFQPLAGPGQRLPLAPRPQGAPGPGQPQGPYPPQGAHPGTAPPGAPQGADPQAASTMLGWQPAPDAGWAPGAPGPGAPGPGMPHGMPPLAPGSGMPGPQYAVPMAAPDATAAMRPATLVGVFTAAARRAFRLHIDPSEVTDAERAALESAAPPVTDQRVQAFMTWRRSVHMVVAVAIVPLLFFNIAELVHSKDAPGALRGLTILQFLVDLAFTALLWAQLRRWTQWHRQRRVLALGWLGYFLMPFVFYLYPLRSAFDGALAAQGTDPQLARAGAAMLGMFASVAAMIQLMPKAISLMPGLLRGAITSKLLFPGASGPGWLMLVLAPIYALLMYVVLIIPYQMTGSGYFVLAMLGLIGAQVWLGRMGYQLARPEGLEEAMALVRKVRGIYVALSLFGLVFVMIGLSSLLRQFNIPVWTGVHVILSLLVNVLLLTLIATDLIVMNLARGQNLLRMAGTADAQAELARDIVHFEDPPAA